MKTIEELQELSDNIAKAVFAYHMAVRDNLKESGKEYKVIGDKDDGGFLSETIGRNGIMDVVIDKVRYNNGTENVEAHVCEEDETFIYDKIEWSD